MRCRPWTRSESIAALSLYCKLPLGKISYRNPEVVDLSRLLGRTPSSIALKLVNFARLDPELQKRHVSGMRHGSQLDRQIWNEFYGQWEPLAYEGEDVLARLRGQPIEVSAKIDFADVPREGRERQRVIRARINQAFFRMMVLSSYENRCCITGIGVPAILVASHIVPWAVDKKNRMRPHNGLCLNALHDRAFDQGLLTITPDYKVRLASALLNADKDDALKNAFLAYADRTIRLPQKYPPDPSLLKYHNDHIFLG